MPNEWARSDLSPPAAPPGFAAFDQRLVEAIAQLAAAKAEPALVGLCGSQGSGKSTTAKRIAGLLAERGLRTVVMSLDDFYLTKAERLDLAKRVHPLLRTRGVPGTHDVELLASTLSRLVAMAPGDVVRAPVFDKTIDDRARAETWPAWTAPLDVIILEGWCMGARPEPEARLAKPANSLEASEDPDGRWRAYVNAQLAGPYAGLFARVDLAILLRAPSFDCVFNWRSQQEAGLRRDPGASNPPMTEAELRRFIQHYERLTRWVLEDEPADIVVDIAEDRRPLTWRAPK